jgi:tetratricopeptide (TPR) repeat protein
VGIEEHDEETAVIVGDGEPTVMSRQRPESSAREEPQPEQVGRYRIIGRLGAGGMASVWLGVDPQLGREVAIKRVQAPDPKQRALFLREAQALAAMSHPNVVTIYEVGEHDGSPFLAMERVPGATLRLWLEATRTNAEILEVLRQAGRGLAAAHAQDLVHRDFKPANVIVGTDGRVRVVDFGLARPVDPNRSLRSTEDGEDPVPSAADPHTSDLTLTAPGTVMGTPVYMAPEQLSGAPVGPACDQYAFCTTLYESLYGRRPILGNTVRELAVAKRRGVDPQPPRAGVPRFVHAAVLRGLAADPADRWPSMAALLSALERDPLRRMWRWGAVLVVGGGLLGLTVPLWSGDPEPCTGAEAQLVDVWGPQRKADAEASVRGTGLPYAPQAWERAASTLDAFAASWVQEHRSACEATTVRGEQSADVMDLRMACLHRARQQLDAVVDVLIEADVQVVERSDRVTGGLAALDRCSDIATLRAAVPPPPRAVAPAVEAARAQLAIALTLSKAGKHADAKRIADEAAAAAQDIDYPPLSTEIAALKGRFLAETGPYDESERVLEDALDSAMRWGQWELAVDAAIDLAFLVGYRKSRPDGGLAYAKIARSLLDRAGASAGLRADVHNAIAAILQVQGRHEEAEAEFRASLELRQEALGPDHPNIAKARDNLALALRALGRWEESDAHSRAALELLTETLGATHPDVAQARNNIAVSLAEQGKHEEAEQHFRAVVDSMRASLGDDAPLTADARHNLAAVLNAQERWGEAEAEYRLALAGRAAALSADHPEVAATRLGLAGVLAAQGRQADARALLEESWSASLRGAIPEPQRAEAAFELAKLLWAMGDDRPRARSLAERARDAYRDAGDEDAALRVGTWLDERATAGAGGRR